jgi:MFS family permease
MEDIYQEIKKDFQVKKFCYYGFLKNLRFFEPYLYIYLLQVIDINLFQIGLLLSIQELTMYIFEIPSGIFADQYGKKNELVLCFIFYIISFFLFYVGSQFLVIIFAMIFFGLGEAFRSGTHKAMIYSYLEKKGWFNYKTFVYGRTRSYSLIGSSISSFIAIYLVIQFPEIKTIFLFSIIPYLLDFLLIISYPPSLNEPIEKKFSFKKLITFSIEKFKNMVTDTMLRKIILSSSVFDAIFKSLKDYIQPILSNLILASGTYFISSMDAEVQLKIALGIIYGVIYIFSAGVSRNIYRLNTKWSSADLMDISFVIFGVTFFVLAFTIKKEFITIVILLYLVLYLLKDGRRPLVVDVFGNYMKKDERATVMSIESQTRSLLMVILAPLMGYIAHRFNIPTLFFIIGLFLLIINYFIRVKVNQK